jgi:hypothetical protein
MTAPRVTVTHEGAPSPAAIVAALAEAAERDRIEQEKREKEAA